MKKITIVLDGVADRAYSVLDEKTPLEYANKPHLNKLFSKSKSGLVNTIPTGLEVGSAVGNLSLLGFDPSTYKGRAVLEAASLNLSINPEDLYIRCNFVTFEGATFEESCIKSYSANEVETQIALPIHEMLKEKVFNKPDMEFIHAGSFRNILIIKNGKKQYPLNLPPAHDVIGQQIGKILDFDSKEGFFYKLMKESYGWLSNFSTGAEVNGTWLWGASVAPHLKGENNGKIILAETLLLDGIAKIADIKIVETIREDRTYKDFLGEKLKKSIQAVKEYDNIYIHLQETDDLSHELQVEKKVVAIEETDKYFIKDFLESINDDYTLNVASDHFTFADTGAHGGAPVPFIHFDSKTKYESYGIFCEKDCGKQNYLINARDLLAM